ncbi:MAG: hypothetical protein ACKVWV_13530 [Planctomycetota bacterium]
MSASGERIIDCLPPRDGKRGREWERESMSRHELWIVALVVGVGFALWWIFGRKSS